MLISINHSGLGFCSSTANLWQFFGLCLLLFKIIIPVLLIIIGVIALGKAVISDDDKELKKCLSLMLKKFILAVCIFFIPTVVTMLFGLVTDFNEVKDDYEACKTCIVKPNGDTCTQMVLALEDID